MVSFPRLLSMNIGSRKKSRKIDHTNQSLRAVVNHTLFHPGSSSFLICHDRHNSPSSSSPAAAINNFVITLKPDYNISALTAQQPLYHGRTLATTPTD
ncbi:MAG: hypothetical protein ABIO50_06625 [Nitrosospira sp.]